MVIWLSTIAAFDFPTGVQGLACCENWVAPPQGAPAIPCSEKPWPEPDPGICKNCRVVDQRSPEAMA